MLGTLVNVLLQRSMYFLTASSLVFYSKVRRVDRLRFNKTLTSKSNRKREQTWQKDLCTRTATLWQKSASHRKMLSSWWIVDICTSAIVAFWHTRPHLRATMFISMSAVISLNSDQCLIQPFHGVFWYQMTRSCQNVCLTIYVWSPDYRFYCIKPKFILESRLPSWFLMYDTNPASGREAKWSAECLHQWEAGKLSSALSSCVAGRKPVLTYVKANALCSYIHCAPLKNTPKHFSENLL